MLLRRAIENLLDNAAKHSESTGPVRLDAQIEDGALRVTVADNGVGGASITVDSGLAGLRDRLEALDATLEIESEPGRGTTVSAEIPCGS